MLITGYTDLYDRHFGKKDSNLARLPDERIAGSLVAVFISLDEYFAKMEPSPITPKPKKKR